MAQPDHRIVAQLVRRFGLALACAAAIACSRGEEVGGDGGKPDPGKACRTARTCDGTKVVTCSKEGQPTSVVTDCAQDDLVCSLGRCTSRACQTEEQSAAPTYLGCLFYTLHVDNVTADGNTTSSVLVTNPGDSVATVELLQRADNGPEWRTMGAEAVEANQTVRIVLPPSFSHGTGNLTSAGALQLTSSTPVSAAHFQSDDESETATSSGGTQLLPEHVLGLHYMAMTYPQIATPRVAQTAGGHDGAGQIIIVATQDDTNVTFTLSASSKGEGQLGGTPPLAPGDKFSITLSDGDMYQIFGIAEGDDLTGSRIDSDRPVAVFSGNISTAYGRVGDGGINSPDMAHEQMLPIGLWATELVAAQLPPQPDTCDSVLEVPNASVYRVLAAQNGTVVRIMGPPTLVGAPADAISLDAGEVRELVIGGGSFRVSATKPVMVTQGIDCEPTLSSAVATMRMLSDLRFAVLPRFDQMIAVVRPAGVQVQLDEAPIDDAAFAPAGGGFEVARITLPRCDTTDVVCTHHLSGQFGMTMRGMDVIASYALTIPTWLCDPDSAGCVD